MGYGICLDDPQLTNFCYLVRENDLDQRIAVAIWDLLLLDQCKEKRFAKRAQPWFLWFSEYDECLQGSG